MLTPQHHILLTTRFPAGLLWSCDAEGIFHFRNGTKEEQAQAQALIDAFDPIAEEAAEAKRQALATAQVEFGKCLHDVMVALLDAKALTLDALPKDAQEKFAAVSTAKAK
jgi:hypothetical protein